MAVKKILLILFLAFVFLAGCCVFQKKYFAHKNSEKITEDSISKNRDLILGHPQFIQNKEKDSSALKKHIEKQWALKNISILKAWKLLEGKTKKTPIVVAVVDTGIHTKHPCLKNNLWINKGEVPNNGKDDDKNGFIDDIHGWNFVHNNNNIQDLHGHGTHISGIIAAQGKTPNSPNCQVIGVAPHVRIMTLKYFEEGESNNNIENTVKSIEYAVANGADIINYSGGGPGANNDERSAIAKAADKNIIFVAALGNDGSKISKINEKDTKPLGKDKLKIKQETKKRWLANQGKEHYLAKQVEKYYPASYELPNIIYLQSQNEKNEIINSSNRIQVKYLEDKRVQTAPGENIISTLPPKKYLQTHFMPKVLRTLARARVKHDNYGYMTGTSQATAVATGVVALVKTLYPSWNMEKQINQVAKTGFGQETDKIKEKTNQGKKLDAYEALTMRDNSMNTLVDEPISDPVAPEEDPTFKFLKDINKFKKQKSK